MTPQERAQEIRQQFEKRQDTTEFLMLVIGELIRDLASGRTWAATGEHKPRKQGLFTVAQAAEYFSVTTRTIYEWERRGWLKGERIGGGELRFTQSSVDSVRRVRRRT